MLIRFWCDSEITFLRGVHKKLVTVLYFSIINVLCGAGGDASFAPQANLVFDKIFDNHNEMRKQPIVDYNQSSVHH